MVTLGNSPSEVVVLALEARKSFALRVELRDPHDNVLPWDEVTANLAIGTIDRAGEVTVLTDATTTDGLFQLQAAELDLHPGTYQFTITALQRGYSHVLAKGEVRLRQNTETIATSHTYSEAEPAEALAVQVAGLQVLRVHLQNIPLVQQPLEALEQSWLAMIEAGAYGIAATVDPLDEDVLLFRFPVWRLWPDDPTSLAVPMIGATP